MKINRNVKIERERPQRDDEPGYYTFLSAAVEMPAYSDTELKDLDRDWRYRTAKLFSRAATSVSRAGSTPTDPNDER